ncbi:MAG: TlpA disulfide reductase family protein [Pseudomonadota bacterium]
MSDSVTDVVSEARALAVGEMENFQIYDQPVPLPDLAITDEAGNPVTLGQFKGRVVLLNIWATWCKPCIAEMPSLNALQERAGGGEFDVVPLSLDKQAVVVQQFYKELELHYLLIFMDENGTAISDLEVAGLPTSILVDHEGRAVGRLTGDADWNADEVIKLVGTFFRAARREQGS